MKNFRALRLHSRPGGIFFEGRRGQFRTLAAGLRKVIERSKHPAINLEKLHCRDGRSVLGVYRRCAVCRPPSLRRYAYPPHLGRRTQVVEIGQGSIAPIAGPPALRVGTVRDDLCPDVEEAGRVGR